jgi:hypothetical protein
VRLKNVGIKLDRMPGKCFVNRLQQSAHVAMQVGRFPPNRLHPFYFGCETVLAVDEE